MVVPGSADQRAFRHVGHDPVAKAFAEAAVIEDFIDFLEDDGDFGVPVLPAPDPLFRERLRRRIWRSMGFTLMRDVRDIH